MCHAISAERAMLLRRPLPEKRLLNHIILKRERGISFHLSSASYFDFRCYLLFFNYLVYYVYHVDVCDHAVSGDL